MKVTANSRKRGIDGKESPFIKMEGYFIQRYILHYFSNSEYSIFCICLNATLTLYNSSIAVKIIVLC